MIYICLHCQFTEQGHIFEQVHIAYLSNLATKAKVEPVANGINAYKDEKTAVATSVSLNTLKWF